MKFRTSPQALQVLSEFLQDPDEWKYGYDLSRQTGLKSGTLYPLLIRLASFKLLQTRWDAQEGGRPPRHMYKLTANGRRWARAHRYDALPRPAVGLKPSEVSS